MGDLLAIDVEEKALAALKEVASKLRLDVATALEQDGMGALRRARGLEAVVVGDPVEDPLSLAQRIYRLSPELPVLLLVDEERRQRFIDAVRFAPYIGEVACVLASAPDEVREALNKLVVTARRKKEHARTLAALDARLQRVEEEPSQRRGAEILGALLETAPVGVVVLDATGNVRGCNPKASEIFDVSARELLGSSFFALFPPAEAGKCRVMIDRVGAAAKPSSVQCERPGPQGARFVDVTAAALAEGGNDRGYLIVLQDATERVHTVAALKDAVRVRDEFVMIASHELKTPLTALQLQVDRLFHRVTKIARDEESAAWLNKWLAGVRRQGGRLERLVDDLLAVSRAGEGATVLQLEELDLAAVVTGVVRRFENDGAIQRADCQLRLKTEPAVGNWDFTLVEQIVTNLVSNALKYASGTQVDLSVENREHDAVFTIQDHGIGIPPEAHERIFEKFERAVSVRNYSGFGIGLFTVKRAVDLLGGRIRVFSEEGDGATFSVVLPHARSVGAQS